LTELELVLKILGSLFISTCSAATSLFSFLQSNLPAHAEADSTKNLDDFRVTQIFGGVFEPSTSRLNMTVDVYAKIGSDTMRETDLHITVVKSSN
jgi:hypothetical protein